MKTIDEAPAAQEVSRATHSVWVARMARMGFAARAAVYLLLVYLSIRVAFGHSRQETDREGALRTIARQPAGHPLLLVLAAGFACYSLWQLSVGLFGHAVRAGSDRPGRRVVSLLRGVVYGLFCASAVGLAVGSRRGGASSDQKQVEWTGRVMIHSYGRVIVGLVGLVVIIIAAGLLWQVFSGKREVDLRPPSRRMERWVEWLRLFGSGARAVIAAAVGVFVVQAALDFNAGKAKGLDGTLKSFAHTPAGPWLLVLVAAGLGAFGLYSLAEAMWAEL